MTPAFKPGSRHAGFSAKAMLVFGNSFHSYKAMPRRHRGNAGGAARAFDRTAGARLAGRHLRKSRRFIGQWPEYFRPAAPPWGRRN
jgi:hypothetical protein